MGEEGVALKVNELNLRTRDGLNFPSKSRLEMRSSNSSLDFPLAK